MNLQDNPTPTNVVVTLSVFDHRGWQPIKHAVMISIFILQPIVLGTLLQSFLLQLIGFIMGAAIAIAWVKRHPLDRKFTTKADAIRHIESLDLPEGEATSRLH